MKTLDRYLTDNWARGVIDHVLRAHVNDKGVLTFYIHPQGVDGDTLDFLVEGNTLRPDPKIVRQEEGA